MTVARPSTGRFLADDVQQAIRVGLEHVFDRDHPRVYGALRRHRPIARFGPPLPITAVSRRADVLAILDDPQTFPTAYGPHLPGPFVLGLEGPAHDRFAAELRAVVRPQDAARVGELAAATARDSLQRAVGSRLDVGADLVHPAQDRIIADYLGVPGPDEQPGRGQQTQWQWAEDLFEEIFLNGSGSPATRDRAAVAAAQMGAHVEALLERRRAAGATGDDVLGRLLRRARDEPATALTDDELRFSLVGLAIGWLWHGARAALIAMDELLADPAKLAAARLAACDVDDADRLRCVLWEVLRFRPVQPFLLRVCARDTVLAPGTDHQRRLPARTLLAVGTHSAMWDPEAIPCPQEFDPTRADEQYLIFGRGAHACLGEAIARVQLPEMLRPILALDGLRRAPRAAGRLRWSGPRPVGLSVTWPA